MLDSTGAKWRPIRMPCFLLFSAGHPQFDYVGKGSLRWYERIQYTEAAFQHFNMRVSIGSGRAIPNAPAASAPAQWPQHCQRPVAR